jgi:glucose 1-dehydrogenase
MSSNSFKGQVAIVTGAGQGIGLEICRQLAANGALVLLNDKDEKLTQKATESINNQWENSCYGLAGDSGDKVFVHKMVETAVSQFGKLTIAIANAGITLFGDFLTYPEADFFSVLHTNLGGSFFLSQAAAHQMIQQGSGGSILLMSSVTAHTAHKNLAAYSMTKAAIEMLAKNLVVELAPHGISVNAIAPGATLTERTQEDASYLKTWSEITPMARPAAPSDIAHAALFMVSENARHITGQSLVVDGGWSSVSPSPY